jgi:hypothetical protein
MSYRPPERGWPELGGEEPAAGWRLKRVVDNLTPLSILEAALEPESEVPS